MRDDVRVVEERAQAGLSVEARDMLRDALGVGLQELERDLDPLDAVEGPVDDAEAAGADLAVRRALRIFCETLLSVGFRSWQCS